MDLFWQLPDAVSYAIGSHGKTTMTDTHINIIYHITDVGTIEGFSQIFWITFFYDTAKLRSLYLISTPPLPSPPPTHTHCLRSFPSPCLRPLSQCHIFRAETPPSLTPTHLFTPLVSRIGTIIFQVLHHRTKAVTNGHSISYKYTIYHPPDSTCKVMI